MRDGPYSKAWEATLKSDCPQCPWWDERRPLKGGKDALPLVLGPELNGRGGTWTPELFWDEDVPQVRVAAEVRAGGSGA